jgi:hypothetical protein
MAPRGVRAVRLKRRGMWPPRTARTGGRRRGATPAHRRAKARPRAEPCVERPGERRSRGQPRAAVCAGPSGRFLAREPREPERGGGSVAAPERRHSRRRGERASGPLWPACGGTGPRTASDTPARVLAAGQRDGGAERAGQGPRASDAEASGAVYGAQRSGPGGRPPTVSARPRATARAGRLCGAFRRLHTPRQPLNRARRLRRGPRQPREAQGAPATSARVARSAGWARAPQRAVLVGFGWAALWSLAARARWALRLALGPHSTPRRVGPRSGWPTGCRR